MSSKLGLKLALCAALVIPLQASSNFVLTITRTYATSQGASAATMVTGDPAILWASVTACLGIQCGYGLNPSPGAKYSWSQSAVHGGDCSPAQWWVEAETTHRWQVGSDSDTMFTSAGASCELVPE